MCACNGSSPTPQTEFDVFDKTGKYVKTVQGQTTARIEVSLLGGGKYVVKGK
jgi:hypothetical protein